jgi:iron complex outermembrane receptor protein
VPLTSYRGPNHVFRHSTRRRPRAVLLATTVLALNATLAHAQNVTSTELPPVDVSPPTDQNKTRARPTYDESGGTPRPVQTTAPARGTGTGTSDAASTGAGTGTGSGGTGVRQFNGIVGTASTVITAEDIAHSPSNNLPDILAQVPGVQLTSLFGMRRQRGEDLRRFARLRRLRAFQYADPDQRPEAQRRRHVAGRSVDHSAQFDRACRDHPGNSGAVLYGDNAIGGVINIVTKSGVGGPPVAIRGEAGVGSFNQRLANISTSTNYGPWSTSFYGNAIKSDGYRENNALDQRNGVGSINYTTPDLKAFLTVTGDDQKLGLPGERIVDPSIGVNELVTNRRGAATPFDYSNQQGASATGRLHQDPLERCRSHR